MSEGRRGPGGALDARVRRIVTGSVAVLVLGLAAGPGQASAAAVPEISGPARCVAGSCRAAVSYTPDPGQSAKVEVSWRHAAPYGRNTPFKADLALACAAPGTPDAIYATAPDGEAGVCSATGPVYTSAGKVTVLVRVTPVGGTTRHTRRSFDVVAAGTATKPKPGKRPGSGPATAEERLCAGSRGSGVQCGPGAGRRTAGGGAKVSHKGWPSITGILWKVTMAGGRHRMAGGPKNDELLGHLGDEVLHGRGGKDVLWGDWDPYDNNTRQVDRLYGEAGNDWIYSSHGRNTISGGAGKDYIWAYYGRGTIDCGSGFDTVRIRAGAPYRVRNCERVKNFCSFGSKPGNKGGCYKPGERPASRRAR